ncbi:hypothetical protein KKHLCK_08190 [Candidatus Electrothrix laxa]
MDNERREMKNNTYMYLCACLLLCGTAASAESLGSSNNDIRKNFNRLVTTKKCPGCNLKGAVLTRMDLREADLQGADLSRAKLNLTNLSKANLKNTVLRGAALGGADFSGADLRGADLTNAQLAGAYFKEAILDQKIIPEKPYEPKELPKTLPDEVELPEASEVEDAAQEALKIAIPVIQKSLSSAQKLITLDPKPDAVPSDFEEDEALRPAKIAADMYAHTPTDTSGGIKERSTESSAAFVPPEQPVKAAHEFGEKKKKVVRLPELPDIAGRTATTVRPKELVPIAEAQIVNSGRAASQLDTLPDTDTAQAESKSAGLDDIPVIDTAPEQETGKVVTEETEPSIWKSFTSLFSSDTSAEKKKTEKAVTQKEKDMPSTAQQQVGAYTVETFGQSRARVQTLVNKLHKKRRCVSCDLAGADLAAKDLEEVDLERADLSGAKLEKADLRAANLKGVNFTDANLKNADLRKADLYLADFTNADLTGAQLQGALIDSTTFTGAIGAKVEAAHE